MRMSKIERTKGLSRITPTMGLAALSNSTVPCQPVIVGVVVMNWSLVFSRNPVVPSTLSALPQSRLPSTHRIVSSRSGCAAHHLYGVDQVLTIVQQTAGRTVDVDMPLMDAGVDSLGAIELRNQLQAVAGDGIRLPNTLVFDHPTVRALVPLIQRECVAPSCTLLSSTNYLSVDAAISGTACTAPGNACSTQALLRVMATCRETVSSFPRERESAASSSTVAIECGTLQNFTLFDNRAFRISPGEASAMVSA